MTPQGKVELVGGPACGLMVPDNFLVIMKVKIPEDPNETEFTSVEEARYKRGADDKFYYDKCDWSCIY